MSTDIDNRIVSMKFDNKQFEAGVGTSLSTLDKLKKGLNLKGAAKGLEDVGRAASNVSFNGMTTGIETVRVKFSALQVMAVTALSNITTSALNAGKNLVKSFTIDPIKDGLKEYETQMNAIQTILANTSTKGTTLKEVKGALAELNEYSDKTIYNFTEMTKNIGTFTAAGIALKPATAAIKGIANLAAVSGSSADQASTAMYQLSQAMASGSVKLMDWNSVVNAGMGGEVFQNSLKETARSHGINIDKMIKNEGSFRETLKDGWLSTNILTETLSKFTGDLSASQLKQMGYTDKQIEGIIKMGKMANDAATKVKTFTQLMGTLKEAAGSGWAQTWEVVLGDFEEAKKMFTSVSNVLGGMIGASAKARNSMLKGWKDLGGRTVLIDAISIAFNNVMSVVKSIGSAFRDVFPPTTSKQLFNFTNGLKALMVALTPNELLLKNIHKTFEGLFSVLSIVSKAVMFVVKVFALVAQAIFPVQTGFFAITGGLGAFLTMINNVIEYLHLFDIALMIIAVPIKILGTAIRFIMEGIAKGIDLVGKSLTPYIERVKEWVRTSTLIEDILSKITAVFGPYIAAVKNWIKTSTLIEDVLDSISVALSGYIASIENWVKTSTLIEDVCENVTAAFGPYIAAIKEFVKTSTLIEDAFDWIKGVGKGFVSTIKSIGSGVSKLDFSGATSAVANFGDSLASSGKRASDSFSGLGSTIDKIKSVFEKIGAVIKSIFGPAISFVVEKLREVNLADIAKILAGGGILLIAKGIKDALGAFKDAMGSITGVTEGFTKVIDGISGSLEAFQTKLKADALFKIAAAIGLLALSIVALSLIDDKELYKAMFVLTTVFAELAGTIMLLQKATISAPGLSGKLIALGIAILLLTISLKKLSELDDEGLSRGIQGLAGVLTTLGLFISVTGKSAGIQNSMTGLIGLSIAVLILCSAVEKFGAMDKESLDRGIQGLITSLMALAVFIKVIGNPERMIAIGFGLTGIAVAMTILAGAVAILGNMDIKTLAKGIGSIALILLSLAVAMRLMPPNSQLLAFGVSLNAMGLALYVIAGALAILGNMDVLTLNNGLKTMATSLGILALTAKLMTGALPGAAAMVVMALAINMLVPAIAILGNLEITTIGIALLALAGIFVVLGLAGLILTPLAPIIFTLCGSIALLGAGVYLLGGGLVMFAAGLAALAAGGGLFVAAFIAAVLGILTAIPTLELALEEALLTFIRIIGRAIPELMVVVKTISKELIKAFDEIIIPVVTAAVKFILALLLKINEYINPLMDAATNLIVGFIKGITKNLPKIIDAATDFMIAFLEAVTVKLPEVIDAAVDLVLSFILGIASKLPDVIDTAFKLIITFINGLADAINDNAPAISNAMAKLLRALIDAIWGLAWKLVSVGGDIVKDILKGIGDSVGGFFTAGVNAVKGFLSGIVSIPGRIWDAGANLGKAALDGITDFLDINSPSRRFRDEVGIMIGKGMAEGIKASTPEVETAATKMSKSVLESAKKFIDDKKYYNQISLEEELYVWETIQKKYKTGDAARIEADREVYRLKKELVTRDKELNDKKIEDEKAALKNLYDTSVAQLDELKYYNKLTLSEELADWKLIQQYYEEGTDERKQADREVYRLKRELTDKAAADAKELKELNTSYSAKVVDVEKNAADKRKTLLDDYYAKTKEINDKQITDIETLNKSYKDAVNSRAQSLYSSSGLFDAVSAPAKTSGAKLIKNLQDQNKEFTSWQQNIQGLSQKGVSTGLIDELTAMGPKSLSQIKALNNLTGSELNTYVSLWQQKHDQAKTQAVSELEGLRLETLTKVSQINSDTTTALNTLTTTWSSKTKEINDDSKTQLDLLKSEWNTAVGGLTGTVVTQVETMGKDIKTTVTTLNTETVAEFKTLADNLQTTMVTPDWVSVGENIILGIKQGVTNKATELAQEVARIALMSLTAAKTALGIKSPSTAFAEVGTFCGEGFIVGLSNYGSKVYNTATNVGGVAVNAMSNAIAAISEVVAGDIDSQPVIRPVLDLSNITSGAKTLSSMFDKNQNISAISTNVQRNNNQTQNQPDDLKGMIKGELGKINPNNQNGLSLNIENFVNNREQDIENLATEFAFYMKQKQIGGSV